MSEQNGEVVRSAVAAFNERDLPSLETIFSDDLVLQVIGGLSDMTGSVFRGKGAAMGWIRDLLETISGSLAIETLRPVGDRLLLIGTLHTSGTASGAEASWQIGQVYSFRDGRITALDSYYTADEALKAVGCKE